VETKREIPEILGSQIALATHLKFSVAGLQTRYFSKIIEGMITT
jgi:hypothetical protein